MTTPKDLAKANERIKKAIETGARDLSLMDLSSLDSLDAFDVPLRDAQSVKTLNLANTRVTDLTPIAGMNRMTALSLSGTQVTDLSPIAGMNGIATLSLSTTQVTDLSPIAGMTGITALSLHKTKVTDLSPIAGMNGITTLRLSGTQVTDLSPIAGLTGITKLFLEYTPIRDLSTVPRGATYEFLDLRGTNIADLRPLLELTFTDEPGQFTARVGNTPAARADPRIAEIDAMEDHPARLKTLLDYLREKHLPEPDIETMLRGPILADTLADVTKPAERFEATTLSDHPDKDPDKKFTDIVDALVFAAKKLGATEVQNRLGNDVAQSFREYHQFVSQTTLNPRLLRYLAEGIRGAVTNVDTVAALDSFDLPLIEGFLTEHDSLMNGYFNRSLSPVTFDVETDPEILARELFPKLDSAKKILADADAAGLFAPSVSDALEILHRRAEGARKQLIVTGDEAKREVAVVELQRSSLLITSYLGRIKGRLTQWVKKFKETPLKDQVDGVLRITGLIEVAQQIVTRVTPIFQELWRLIGNLPLPF